MFKDAKVQYEMVSQAHKKLEIAVKRAERKREWLDVTKFKKLQETIDEKLRESRERGAERQREAKLKREAEESKEAAVREAKDLEARAARVQAEATVREDGAAELAPHLHESDCIGENGLAETLEFRAFRAPENFCLQDGHSCVDAAVLLPSRP